MPRICQVTGKRHTRGNNKSHAHNLTRRSFKPNIQSKRFWFENENRFVKLRVSAKGMKKVDKVGIEAIVEELRARGEKI